MSDQNTNNSRCSFRPSNMQYKKQFLEAHKGHHQTYIHLECLALFCEQCNEFHFLQPIKKQKGDLG